MSVLEYPAPIKTEPADDTCAVVLDYDEARIKTERALLYADHEVQDEMVIGPTEIRRPLPGVNYPHWEAARRAVAKAGVDNEVEFLLRLYSNRLVLRDVADELLCARCGQWSPTAAELHQHQGAAHSTEHPKHYLQPTCLPACTTHLGNGFQAQPTTFTDQRENTSPPTTLTHKLFICDLCQKHFTTKSLLSKHVHSHTKTDSCHQRDMTFKLKNHSKQRKVVPNPTNSLSCDVCSKHYSSKSSLNYHKLIHTGIKTFTCDKCGKNFTHKCSFSRHMLIHNGSKGSLNHLTTKSLIHKGIRAFECDNCGKSYTQKSYLVRHMLNHNGFKALSCEECSMSFILKFTLSRHMLIHNGSKPFLCQKCSKSFASKYNLSRHMLVHNKFKAFSCDICGKSLTYKSSLPKHMLIHDGSKPFACTKCSKRFTQNSSLHRHMLIHD